MERIGVKTGNHLIYQFEPAYFGTAHAFIFSYNFGFPDMPAFSKKGRGRRQEDAPRIETWEWVRAMSRRAEASVSGDYSFGFLTWNYLFRSSINLTQSLFAYERKNNKSTGAKFSPQDIEEGAISIAKALWGKYKDLRGKSQSVGGDMTKVRFVPGLSDAAHLFIKNILVIRLVSCLERRRQSA